MTNVVTDLFAMSWTKRVLLLLLIGVGASLLGIVLSAALAHPAGAATLPLPSAPSSADGAATSVVGTITGDVPGSDGAVNDVTGIGSTVATGATSVVSGNVPPLSSLPVPTTPLPVGTLPVGSLPVPAPTLPIPSLPVITKSSTGTTGPTASPTGTTETGPLPGTGGPAHGSNVKLSSPEKHRSSTAPGSTGSATLLSSGSGSPSPTPVHRPRSPWFPFIPSAAGDAAAPGHGGSPWNVVPLTILLLAVLVLGGVALRRRHGLKFLFDSRFAPPG
jgi:hypothetical protein